MRDTKTSMAGASGPARQATARPLGLTTPGRRHPLTLLLATLLAGCSPAATRGTDNVPQSTTHVVTVQNDTDWEGELQLFVFEHYTDTLTTVGTVRPGDTATVTVPAGIETSYVFYLTAKFGNETARMNSSVRENRLVELGWRYRFLQDDMGAAAVDPEDWPTPAGSPTPWDISGVPTSTDEPVD